MDTEQRIAFVQSQVLCTMAEIEAMKAKNSERILAGFDELAYDEIAFQNVPANYGLEHNTVLIYLQGGS